MNLPGHLWHLHLLHEPAVRRPCAQRYHDALQHNVAALNPAARIETFSTRYQEHLRTYPLLSANQASIVSN